MESQPKLEVVFLQLRLWTMYELATFLPKRGPGRLVVLPTFLIRCTIFAVPVLMLHCVWVQLLLVDQVGRRGGSIRVRCQLNVPCAMHTVQLKS